MGNSCADMGLRWRNRGGTAKGQKLDPGYRPEVEGKNVPVVLLGF